jgi:membrane peptidoglycan carboxypeptidase
MNTSSGPGRSRRPRNTFTTNSGKNIKVNRTMGDRSKARKLGRAAEKATYLSTLPKAPLKRVLYRMNPKRVINYWFSREGGIMALKLTGVAILVGFFLTVGLFAYFRKDLPKIRDIAGSNLGGSITYYDRTGQTVLWQDYDAVKRLPVDGSKINNYLREATVAIEDKDFYKHGAFDTRGIIRAASKDVSGGGSVQGGSTITQQFVKLNQQWTDDRTITRKVKELILAVELEREYSKADILTGYLNIAPYGGVEYGAEAAARDYFQIGAKDLSLAQSAMLAAIPQAPSYYSPYASHKYNPAVTVDTFDASKLIGRQHYILDQMAKQGYITQAVANEAKKVDVLATVKPQATKYQNIKAPYFVLAAKQELQQVYGKTIVQRGGLKVTTTLDMNLQTKSEQLTADNVKNINRYGADESAMVAEDVQTGQIVSLVGGTDFFNADHGQDNYAAGIKIPPGSSFKPYDYATLIDNNNNVGAGSVLYDSQGTIPGYPCTNKNSPKTDKTANCLWDYDFRYPGAIPIRYALGGSRNVPAVKAMLSAVPNDKSPGKVDSINKVISTASAMMSNTSDQQKNQKSYNCYGDEALTQTTQCYGASGIGDGAFLHLDDHVNGLSTLARLGNAIPRTYLLKVVDASNKTIRQFTQPKGTQAIKADAAFIVDDMASDYKASYLPGSCTDTTCTPLNHGGYKFQRFDGWKFAVKTGTTNDNYDGLMTSWSSKYAVVTWVGNHTRNVALKTSMEALTEPLARGFMEYAHTGLKPVNWTQPADIKTGPAFVVRNHIALGSIEPSPTNDFYPASYAGGAKTSNTSTVTDKISGKAATSCTPALAKQTSYNSNAQFWNIDQFMGGNANSASTAKTATVAVPTDDVHNCNDAKPSITLTAPNDCGSSCTITATVTQGTHALTDPAYPNTPGTVSFSLGGQVINTSNVSSSPSTVSFTYTPTSTGNGSLTATVTDSVLYEATSDAQNISYAAVASNPITTFSANHSKYTWSGGASPYTVIVSGSGVTLCSTASGDCVPNPTVPAGTKVTVRDSSGSSLETTVSGGE